MGFATRAARVLIFLGVAGSAMANADEVLPNGDTVPRVFLQEFVSSPGQELDDFVVSIAPHLRNHTLAAREEICGSIGYNSTTKQYGVRVYTNHGVFNCLITLSDLPEGMEKTMQTVHTHPASARIYPKRTDVIIGRNSGMNVNQSVPENLMVSSFSQGDLKAGPGYLVTKTKVLAQRGAGHIRTVAFIRSPWDPMLLGNGEGHSEGAP